MSPIHQIILGKLQKLPPVFQGEVLNFIESLQQTTDTKLERRMLRGIWADVEGVTEEDIAEARQEMWSNFSREIE